MPTPKKHASVRARRNVAATATTMGPTSRRRPGAIPELPVGMEWHPYVHDWWADLWASPMSDEYHDSDLHQLYVLAGLYHAFYMTPEAKVRDRLLIAAEVRLQRQAFGLTPYDRRRLEWTIETAEDVKDKGRARRERQGAPPAAADDDPRRGLRTVS